MYLSKIKLKLIECIFPLALEVYGRLNFYLPFLKLPPLLLNLNITSKCNLSCSYCYQSGNLNLSENDNLTIMEWENIISKLPRWTIIDISGGEPFMSPLLKDILELLLSRGFKVSMITNGTIVNEEIINLIVKKKLYYLSISLDGNKYHNDKIRKGYVGYDNVVKFCELLNKYKQQYQSKYPIVTIKTSILEDNTSSIQNMRYIVFNKLQAEQHNLNLIFQNMAREGRIPEKDKKSNVFLQGNTVSFRKDKINDMILDISTYLKELEAHNEKVQFKPPVTDWKRYIENPKQFGVKRCWKICSTLTIRYDGTITPCYLNLEIANIRAINYSISLAWLVSTNRKFLSSFIRSKYSPACEGCCLAEHSIKEYHE